MGAVALLKTRFKKKKSDLDSQHRGKGRIRGKLTCKYGQKCQCDYKNFLIVNPNDTVVQWFPPGWSLEKRSAALL